MTTPRIVSIPEYAMSSLTRSARTLLVASAILVLPATAGMVQAQVLDAWLNGTPVEPFTGNGSARLKAMGGIEVAIPDDQSRLDPYGYSNNPAGLRESRDSSYVEVPITYQGHDATDYNFANSAILHGAGVRGEFRPGGKWAMAASFDYANVDASRHDQMPSPDDARFIRDFDLPVAPELSPVTTDRTFGAGIQSPTISAIYAREFLEGLTLGARIGYRTESENRRLLIPYDLNVTSERTEIQGGAMYRPHVLNSEMTLSGWGQYAKANVTGVGESPLNEDEFDWDRPEVAYGAAIHYKNMSWLEGIVDGRHRSFDGEEVARINWAPQFFMNPLPGVADPDNVFKKHWSAFLSGLRHNEVSTRWLVGLPGRPVHLGVRWAYYRQFEWIRANEVVIPTVNELDVKREGYNFAGGLSVDLPNKQGVLGAEMQLAREFRQDFTYQIPDIDRMNSTFNIGGEYRLKPALPLRAGVQLIRLDPNRTDASAPVKGTALTLGLGYFWNALQWRIDASYQHYHYNSAPDDPADEIGFGDQGYLFIQRAF
jgi:hypothetical protein